MKNRQNVLKQVNQIKQTQKSDSQVRFGNAKITADANQNQKATNNLPLISQNSLQKQEPGQYIANQ
jgi:hypothetical protein